MDLFDFTAPDQAFWLICVGFYLADSIVLHPADQIILTERLGGGWTPAFPIGQYRLRGRLVTVLMGCLPFLGATRSNWLASSEGNEGANRFAHRRLGILSFKLLPFRVLGTLAFVSTFIVGPVVTEIAGPGVALLVWAPLHLLLTLALAVLLIRARRRWSATWTASRSALASITLECALCPGYFANLCRRLTMRAPPVVADPVDLILKHDGDASAVDALGRLGLLACDLLDDELGPEDRLAAEAWRQRAARALEAHG
ncbi:MAG TPA: hypothetical protein VIO38_17570 [Rariglobus sp.]